jgi:hypothetical protein
MPSYWKEESEACCVMVKFKGTLTGKERSRQCEFKNGYGPGGKYCLRHAPVPREEGDRAA